MSVKNGNLAQFSGWTIKYLKPPPRYFDNVSWHLFSASSSPSPPSPSSSPSQLASPRHCQYHSKKRQHEPLPFLSLGLFTRSRYTEENLDSCQVRPKKEHVFYWRNCFANNLWYSILTREVNIQNQVANSELHLSFIETRNKNTSHCSKVHSHSPLPKGSCWFIIHKHLNLPRTTNCITQIRTQSPC